MKFLRYLGYFTLLLLASIQTIVAQNYPVRIALRLSQPYTIGPSQWCRGMNEKLAVELSNQDSHQTVNIRLRLQVNGPSMHVDTKSRSGSLITLGPKKSLWLRGRELARYFESNNAFFQGAAYSFNSSNSCSLPEGEYEICLKAQDAKSSETLGQASCGRIRIKLNGQPSLISPLSAVSVVHQHSSSRILFQWSAGKRFNLNTNVKYEFVLVELDGTSIAFLDENFQRYKRIYKTSTSGTTLSYGLMEPRLTSGKRYAWRVQASSSEGGNGDFSNLGCSKVNWFVYQNESGR